VGRVLDGLNQAFCQLCAAEGSRAAAAGFVAAAALRHLHRVAVAETAPWQPAVSLVCGPGPDDLI